MVGICGLSVDKTRRESFPGDLFLGTFYQQHLDQDWSGLAVINGEEIKCESYPGLFRVNFEEKIKDFEGSLGIGYCGLAREPLKKVTKIGKLAACFSGNIQNCQELQERLLNQGVIFSDRRGNDLDIEVIINLITQEESLVEGIKKMTGEKKIKGTYTLLVLTKEKIVAARHPNGQWPLILGKKEGSSIVASSSVGFSNLGFKIVKDLKPGEIISLQDGEWKQEALIPTERVQNCTFWWLYYDDPFGIREGIPAYQVREKLGANLAKKDIERGNIPDIISTEPASGTSYALGYNTEFLQQAKKKKIEIEEIPLLDEVLIKYGYAHRSFTWTKSEKREWEAEIKHFSKPRDQRGKSLALLDDSIVRGTTKQKVIRKVRTQGFKEIHLRIGSPEIWSNCPWKKGLEKGEPLASRIPSLRERAKFLEVDSLEHNSLEDLFKVFEEDGLARDSLCVDCFLSPK